MIKIFTCSSYIFFSHGTSFMLLWYAFFVMFMLNCTPGNKGLREVLYMPLWLYGEQRVLYESDCTISDSSDYDHFE